MGRWSSSSASDRRVASAWLAALLPLALAACHGRDDDGASTADAAASTDEGSPGALPGPQARPGTSVTGMPTSPPAVASEPATEVAETTPNDATPLPAPVDTDAGIAPPTAGADATTASATPQPSPAPPPPSPADAAAAGNLVTQYMAALGSGAFVRGQSLWSTTPTDSAVLQLARNAPFDVGVGAATADAGGRVTVPVDVHGKADDGNDRHVVATYTVQRGPTGTWRIMSAVVRDATP